jgi:GNAT superfamily N-acetyltransferase
MKPSLVADSVRVWFAQPDDFAFCLHLCKRFRDNEFFFVPDETLRDEKRKGNVIAFDFNRLEAGYIWVTFPKNGRCRINQLAVDEQLWRNKVGTHVVRFFEQEVKRRGGWSVYLSCKTNTPGNDFWPRVSYSPIVEKQAGRRGGMNVIWAKLLDTSAFLFPPLLHEIKTAESYQFQSSITVSKSISATNRSLKCE